MYLIITTLFEIIYKRIKRRKGEICMKTGKWLSFFTVVNVKC